MISTAASARWLLILMFLAAARLAAQGEATPSSTFVPAFLRITSEWDAQEVKRYEKLLSDFEQRQDDSETTTETAATRAETAKWLKKNPGNFGPTSNKVRELVEAHPGHAQISLAMTWLFANAWKVSDRDWAIDYIMAMSDRNRCRGILIETLESDLRPRATEIYEKLLAEIDRSKIGFELITTEWSFLQHLDARLRERMKIRAGDVLNRQSFINRYDRQFLGRFRRESSKGDEAKLAALMKSSLDRARKLNKSVILNGKGPVRWAKNRTKQQARYSFGAEVKTLKGQLTTGQHVTWPLADGGVDLIVFWGPWDREARSALLLVRTLRKKYADTSLRVRLVSTLSKGTETRAAMTKAQLEGDCLLDTKGTLGREWMVWDAPEAFIVDGKGKIRFAGPVVAKQIKRVLELALRKKPSSK